MGKAKRIRKDKMKFKKHRGIIKIIKNKKKQLFLIKKIYESFPVAKLPDAPWHYH